MKVRFRIIKNWRDPAQFSMPSGDFVKNGHGRRFLPHENSPFRADAFAVFGITNLYPEPQFKNFIGNHYLDGAFTHTHTDRAPDGFVHTRCNWMIKKPPVGGDPVLDDEVVKIEPGDLWLCLASMERHGSTPIADGERLICSFGALVSSGQIHSLFGG